ncbi:prolipoprotein diacylglyceryl transferase family protein [Tunturiibacter gelidoferens]|uniref:Phosphatidylglycerol:prolipoprotein diacylglycerol transferase n=1 Tax=Tunturiibacter gelidiferens TaxID=3069689 RepID=A0A9X0U5J8_9BACT|nr:prolipoprotein diacylglyceryl transferase family protein [Edaphobacter lichenicola]MBB5328852.1 phosphatidylglycerol:prolipoprotein diacylglycerol transferase [Edaphobacter lichenicola]
MYPYLIHSGHLLLPTFGVLAALGLMAALTLSLRTAAIVGLNPDKLWNAGLFTLLSAFVLSRLLIIAANLHNFLTYPILLLTLPSLTTTGIFLTILATLIYLRIRHLPILETLNAWSPCATLIWAFLALGHFAEGSDAGLPTTLPWGLSIPPDHTRLHPVALYAAIAAALLTLILLRELKHSSQPNNTIATTLAAAGTIQFLLTFFRQPYPYTTSTLYTALDPIQWIALGMIVVAAVIVLLPGKLVTHAV